ncbi:MAG: hypothetical protein AAFR61_26255 [Bacteroidota bacterium]
MNSKSFLILGVILSMVFSLQAQRPGGGQGRMGGQDFDPEKMVNRQVDRLKEAVGLDEKQEKKVRKLFMAQLDEIDEIRDVAEGDWEYMREEMGKVREQTNEKLQKILSEEQWTKYEAAMKEWREQRGRRGGRQEGGRRPRPDGGSGN